MSLLNFFRDVRRWLAEGDFPAVKTTTVSTDHIAEQTGAHGVTVDNNVTAAGNITLANTKHLLCATGAGSDVGATGTRFGNIYGTTVASVTANHDHIGENTGGHGIVLDNAVNPGGDNTLTLGALATRWSTIYARYMGVYTVNAGATIDCWNYSSTALHQPAFASYRYYGTYASPTAVGSGAYLGALTLYGYDGSGSHVGANIFAYATEAWTHTPEAHGTSVYFQCTPTGEGSAVTIMIMSGTGLSLLNTCDLLSNTAGGSDIGSAANYFGEMYAQTYNAIRATSGGYIANVYSNTAAAYPQMRFVKYRGTSGSPTTVTNGTYLGGLSWYGYDGVGVADTAHILVLATQDWVNATADRGSKMYFQTTTINAASPVARMTLDETGLALLNTFDLLSDTGGGSDVGTATNYFGSVYATTHYADHIGELTAAHTIVFDNNVTITDAKNVILNTTTGTKIGTGVDQKLGFWNAAPVVQQASADQAAVSLDVDVTGADTVDKAAINANFSAIQTLINRLRADLVTTGMIKGAA